MLPKSFPDYRRYGMNKRTLRMKIVRSLRAQGFVYKNGSLNPPGELTKDRIRELHSTAVQHQIDSCRKNLERAEDRLLLHIANGTDISPDSIRPKITEVLPGTED